MADTAIIEKKCNWAKWGDGVTFSVDKDDIVTVNVVKESYIDNCGVEVPYNGTKNSTYKYSFQAWTKFGTREIRICFGSEKNASGHTWHPFEKITITSRKQTYELEYKISGNWQDFALSFNCGGAVGELYIKLISIDSANGIG
jgi:hypothetical protein